MVNKQAKVPRNSNRQLIEQLIAKKNMLYQAKHGQ